MAVAPALARMGAIVLVLVGASCVRGGAATPVERAAAPEVRELPPAPDGRIHGVVEPLPRQSRSARDVLVFGDSVARLVVDDLADLVPDRLILDAIDCRRIDRGFVGPCGGVPAGVAVSSGLEDLADHLAARRSAGAIPDRAVLVLANNSSLRADQVADAMTILGDVEHVLWVNTRIEGFGRQDPNNQVLADLAAQDPRASVIDWFTASADEAWLADHVHPNDAGQVALGTLIATQLDALTSTSP